MQAPTLPKQWTPGFYITTSHSGSMSGGSTQIRFGYNEGEYKSVSHDGKTVQFTFKVTESERKEILEKLRDLKVDLITSTPNHAPVRDGWSQSICLAGTCLEGGTSAVLSADDKNRFLDAYRYLEARAIEERP